MIIAAEKVSEMAANQFLFIKICNVCDPIWGKETMGMIEKFLFRRGVSAFGLLLVLAGILVIPTWAQSRKDRAVFDRLEPIAWKEGRVRVIVKLYVPRIGELTAASTQYKSGQASVTEQKDITAADLALQEAIELSAWTVLSDLQGTEFIATNFYKSIPYLAIVVSPQALNLLYNSPDVLGIEENSLIRLDDPDQEDEVAKKSESISEPNVDRPALDGTAPLVGATTAWTWGFTGKNWYVAVLDTGIRKSHQFFTGKSVIEACFSLGRDGVGGAGDCPNGSATMSGPGSAAHYPSNYIGYDHGTHVSGIAAGNYGSLGGIAKDAGIIAVQVFTKFTSSDCGTSSPCVMTWTSDQLAGLDYIYSIRGSYQIASVNMSLGGGRYTNPCDSDSRKAAIDNLWNAGIATAIATGNNGYCFGISAPACISSAVAVGSSTNSDTESGFNNWFPTRQSLMAPGSSIYSSTGASDSSYASWDGTSMATPHVAGAWAVMKQALASGGVGEFLYWLQATGAAVKSICDNYDDALPRIRIDKALQQFVKFVLSLQTSANGSTNPGPGSYSYIPGSQVTVTATPAQYSLFKGWSGDVSGTASPLTVTMNGNRTVRAEFQYIYAPAATGKQSINRNFAQAEYINNLTWTPNPNNEGLNIASYRIYTVKGSTATILVEVGATTTTYIHRNAGKGSLEYKIAAVVNGIEGASASITVQ